ncbi:MAG TPA: response regulator, partial [Patescibacteria group bacterium]|nr:response regulator [Patescibacteria group bacterium]
MPKILVVEDETAYQTILKDTFEKEGFEVFVVSGANEAKLNVTKNHPDIILLDIILPGGLNGFDFLENLEGKAETRKIPVVVLTNLASEEKVAKEIGASAYYIKADTPIDEVVR